MKDGEGGGEGGGGLISREEPVKDEAASRLPIGRFDPNVPAAPVLRARLVP